MRHDFLTLMGESRDQAATARFAKDGFGYARALERFSIALRGFTLAFKIHEALR